MTAYYIATVWRSTSTYDPGRRQVVRLRAAGVADFEAQVRALWPGQIVTFGPISVSKVQE